jgi:hypothetical protein
MQAAIEQIETVVGSNPVAHRGIKHLRSLLRTYRPGFDDHLEGVLGTVGLPDGVKKTWRRFFRALTILRNKSAHFDPSLTDSERIRLREGGFTALIDSSGQLVMNPRMYVEVATFILDFFDLVCNEANVLRNAS